MANNGLRFEDLITIGGNYGYQAGQSVETSVQQLQEMFHAAVIDEATILEIMRMADPTYTITQQDREQQQARRELSEQTRNNLFAFLHAKAEVTNGVRLPRGLDMLLDFTGGPGAKEHNERVKNAFALDENDKFIGGSIEERTALMTEFIDKMKKVDFGALMDISDEALSTEFLKNFPLYLLCAEGGDKLLEANRNEMNPNSNYFALSPEYTETLTSYRNQYQCFMADLKTRFEAIVNPNYQLIHMERVASPDLEHRPAMAYADEGSRICKIINSGTERGDDLAHLTAVITRASEMRSMGWEDKVNYYARKNGMDPNNFEIVKAGGTVITHGELEGVGMFQLRSLKDGKIITMESDGNNIRPFNPTYAISNARKAAGPLVKALDDADPWYLRMFTGSREYADMKEQMLAVEEAMKKLPDHPDEVQSMEMHMKLRELLDSSSTYLAMKCIMNNDTKDSERARIMAAMGVKEYAEKAMLMLSSVKEMEKEKIAAREKNNAEIGKSLDAIAQKADVDTNEKIDEFYTGHLSYGDRMMSLAKSFYFAVSGFSSVPADPVATVAKMVVYDLVMRERAANNKAKDGPIETTYHKDPEAFCKTLEQNEAIRSIAEGMDTAALRRFMADTMAHNGVQKLTSTVLQEIMPNNAPQIKQSEPERVNENGLVMGGG